MSLLDFLKNRKANQPAKSAKIPAVPPAPPAPVLKPKTVQSRKPAVFSYQAVKQPHISEKATNLAEKNQYVFEISSGPKGPNKKEIKKTVEGVYNVDVLSVNIIKIPAKKRRLGKIEGFRKGMTKAVIKIKEGQKIEIL